MQRAAEFYKLFDEEKNPMTTLSNKLFQLNPVPEANLFWDTATSQPPLFTAYDERTQKIHFYPKKWNGTIMQRLHDYREVSPWVGFNHVAKIEMSHEIQHALHHIARNYSPSLEVSGAEAAVMNGMFEGVAYYGQRYCLEEMQRRDLWETYFSLIKNAVVRASSRRETEIVGRTTAIIVGILYLDRFLKKGEEYYRQFVRQPIRRLSEEEVNNEIKLVALVLQGRLQYF